jgi:hypothetical protein
MNLRLISYSRSNCARFALTFFTAVLCFFVCCVGGSVSSAAIINFSGFSSDGHPVSGSAEFTLNAGADTISVKLTNTTTTTLDAGELFTGLDFSLGGLTPAMTSDTGIQRTVAANGTFSDTGTAQNLSWSLVSLGGGSYQLNFTPNAKDAIIGPPTMGSYSLADGSIKDNAGHTPFAAEMALFELSVPGLEADTPVQVTTWRFGTRLDPAIPEPLSGHLLLMGIAAMACARRRWSLLIPGYA